MQVIWQPGVTLEDAEKQVILSALRYHRGHKSNTAAALGMAIRTLQNKLSEYEASDAERTKSDKERSDRAKDFLKKARGGIGFDQDGKKT